MKNQQIVLSPNLFFVLLLVFLFGTTTVLPMAPGTGHDAWASMIIAIMLGLGFGCIHAYIFSKFPQTHWVDILQKVFGKTIGTFFALFFIGVAITSIGYSLRDFEAFLTSVVYFKTPLVVIGGTYIALVIYAAYQGIESIARCAIPIAVWMVLETLITTFLIMHALGEHPLNNFKPFFERNLREIMSGAVESYTLPFGESVLVWGVSHHVRKHQHLLRKALLATGVAGTLFLMNILRNTALFGDLVGRFFYPSYEAVRFIQIGDTLERLEMLVLVTWTAGGFLKMSIMLYVAATGIQKLFGLQTYKKNLIPIGLFSFLYGFQVSESLPAYFEFIKYAWVSGAMFWQVLLPIVMAGIVWIRFRKQNAKISNSQNET